MAPEREVGRYIRPISYGSVRTATCVNHNKCRDRPHTLTLGAHHPPTPTKTKTQRPSS